MDLLTQPETAEETRLSERTLERHRLAGTGPKFCRLGRRVFYRREDVEEWIAENTCRSTSEADAVAGRCCGTDDANVLDDLNEAVEETPAGISPDGDKRGHPPSPLAGRGTPFDSERLRARNKMARKSSARDPVPIPRRRVSGEKR